MKYRDVLNCNKSATHCDLIYWGFNEHGWHFAGDILKNNFDENLDSSFNEVFYLGSNWQYASIGLGNCSVPTRRQAITWTNGDRITSPWGTYYVELNKCIGQGNWIFYNSKSWCHDWNMFQIPIGEHWYRTSCISVMLNSVWNSLIRALASSWQNCVCRCVRS